MDERLGRNLHGFVDPDPECASVSIGKDGRFDRDAVFLEMREKNGAPLTLVDYASAGKDWESEITAWMKCRS